MKPPATLTFTVALMLFNAAVWLRVAWLLLH